MNRPTTWRTCCPLCNGKGYIEENFENNITDWLTGEEEIPPFLSKKIKSQRSVRKSAISSSGDNGTNVEKIIRRDTGEEEEGISGKEREKNEGEVTRSAINHLGDNGMNLENIIRQMEEKSVSRKEKEKNVVEVTRGTINDSGDNGTNVEKIVRQDTGEEEGISGKERENNEVEVTRTAINNAETTEMDGHSSTGKPLNINNVFLKPGTRPMTQNESRKRGHIVSYRMPDFTKIKPKVNSGLRKRIEDEDEKVCQSTATEYISDEENAASVYSSDCCEEYSYTAREEDEESLRPHHLIKQHQPQHGVKNLQPVKRCAPNQNMIQHGNVTTDRPTARAGAVSRESSSCTVEKPRSTAVPVGSKQKGSSLAVKHSAGVKNGVLPDIRKTMTQLESTEWDIVMGGMQDIRQILRCKPALVEEHITRIYIFLSSAVLSKMSKVSMAACQTAQHIFETVKCTTKHGYHDLVSSLLQKTAQNSKFMGQAAAEALDAMVMNTPPYHSVKALVSYGLRHKNNLVRATASRLLTLVITTSGADAVLGPRALKVFKHEVISTAASFLEDGNIDARRHAQELFKFLMTEYEDCEFVFSEEIEERLLKRIGKKLVSIRAEINKMSRHSSRK